MICETKSILSPYPSVKETVQAMQINETCNRSNVFKIIDKQKSDLHANYYYECNGTSICMWWKKLFHLMKWNWVEWNISSFAENIYSIAWMSKHLLFYITCAKIQVLQQIWRKSSENTFTSHLSNFTQHILCGILCQAKCMHCTHCICPVQNFTHTVTDCHFLVLCLWLYRAKVWSDPISSCGRYSYTFTSHTYM